MIVRLCLALPLFHPRTAVHCRQGEGGSQVAGGKKKVFSCAPRAPASSMKRRALQKIRCCGLWNFSAMTNVVHKPAAAMFMMF